MDIILIVLFSFAGLAAVIGSPAKFVSFNRFADPPERQRLDDLDRTNFAKTKKSK